MGSFFLLLFLSQNMKLNSRCCALLMGTHDLFFRCLGSSERHAMLESKRAKKRLVA